MTSPSTPIADIAYSCGFNDISYFNRCFLKAYGEIPSEYRKKCKAFV
ncbi:helix-turn-helix domain-containing protein [Oribacterium sp. C9]